MGYERGNRVRSTNAIVIIPMRISSHGWCLNQCRTSQGMKKAAAYSIEVAGHPFGLYCKTCTSEIWKIWNELIGEEAGVGTVVRRSKKVKQAA